MPIRNGRPLTFRPRGVSDAVDGTNAFPGAMTALTNLVPAPTNTGIFIPRPASVQMTDFPGFTDPAQGTALLVIGTRVYGMIASSRFAGKDEPFCYDIETDTFITISGVTAALLPATQPNTGDWKPPHMEMIANRIIVTHPGFSGGAGAYFGWIDETGFSATYLSGNTINGSNVIQSITGDQASTPVLDGVQPGQAISGTGIPADTYVVSASDGTVDIQTTGDTHTNTTIDNIADTTGMLPGMYVSGSGVVQGTWITAVAANSITLSQATTATATGADIQVIGGGTITISNPATADGNIIALNISSGTQSSPSWGAGNTNVNPLSAVPAWVSQYNGRAWYAVGDAEVFSDALLPLNVSEPSQALTFGDSTPVTCSIGLPLNNITTGGIVQALIVVKGAEVMYQVTGDQATDNLSSNALNVSIGTLAPNSLCPTPLGIAFVAPDGLRFIDFNARISEPVGANGQGVNFPFLSVVSPSRMCAAFNQNTLRISVQNGQAAGEPVQEYWFNFTLKAWTGPHTFPAALIQPYFAGANGFISFAYGVNAKLWQSNTIPISSSTYTENGVDLAWSYQTVLLPDNEVMAENAMVETTMALQLPQNQQVTVQSIDEVGDILDTVYMTATGLASAVWGAFTWGSSVWGAATGFFKQYQIAWHQPLVFKQMTILVTGASQAGFAIGNLYMRYQILGYLLQA